jgi:hypothetical protein
MMQDINYQLVGGSYPERSPELDVQKTVNWYMVEDPNAVKKIAFAPTPGTQQIGKNLDSSTSPIRQIYSYKNFGLIFVDEKVYSFDQDLDINFVGTIGSNSGYIGVCNGSDQIMITDQEGGYVFDFNTGSLSPIADTYFLPNPLSCVYFNDFFLACDVDTNVWQVSVANDASTWTVLGGPNSATISSKADTFVGMGVVNQRLFLFGNYITEVWYPGVNPQYPQFPFSRDSNSIFEYGCAATGSIANGDKKDDGILFWLAATRNGVGSVMMTDGGKAQRISTPSLDWKIQNYRYVKDAIGFSYNQDGHIFYQLTFPTENVTWLADLTVRDEQGYPTWVNLELLGEKCHMATCHTYFLPQGIHIIGSNTGPQILRLSTLFYTNFALDSDGMGTTEDIIRESIGTNFYLTNYNRFIINKFEVDFETGVGLSNNPGQDPKVYLSISYDYGHTFSDACAMGLGKIGEFKYRAYWFGRGISRNFIAKITVYDPVRTFVMGTSLQINACKN